MSDLKGIEYKRFEDIKHIREDGSEYWSARELGPALDYAKWENFAKVIKRAMIACENSGHSIPDDFPEVRKIVEAGVTTKPKKDYELSRYACYLIVQNGDPRKEVIALGQTYFAIQTYRQEVADHFNELDEDNRRLVVRGDIKQWNQMLAETAHNAGVITNEEFAIFQNAGYMGLYGGLEVEGILAAVYQSVFGGGLDVKNHWKDNGKDFFLPIKVISKTFRGKYMAELKQLWENDRLEFHGSAAPYKNYYTFKELLNTCYAKEWIPYCKKPFDGAESVIRYLGKYTHRIAISNYRIKDMTESTVTFSAKDYKNQGLWKEITISGEEFIRRFLMHVPPKRFVRIRHYGLLSSRNKKKKITLCRNILGCKKYISKLKDMDAPAIIRLLYNKDICKCSSCGGKIIPLPTEQHFIKPKPHMLC